MTEPSASSSFDVHTFIKQEAKLSALSSLVQSVEDAETFVQELPDLSYEVSKTLHGWVGKKVTRRLKLTTRGIANLRRSGETSSLYEYDRIIKVTMSNVSTLVIEYKGAKHPYTYSSPVAMEIAHEIQTRMKFFNAAIKKRLTLRLASPYLDVLEGLRATRRETAFQPSNPTTRTSLIETRTSRSTISQAQAHTIGDAATLKLTSQINSFLLDRSFEEAKVLKSFLDSFDSVEKNAKTCVETTRGFLTSLKERIMDVRIAALIASAPPHVSTAETQTDSIGREVELCIEKATLLKLHDRILDVLAKIHKKEDQRIESQVDVLQAKPQSYFGVPPNLEASSKWQLAVLEINEIATMFLPQEKLRAILSAIAAIVDTAQFESDRRLNDTKNRGSLSNPSSSGPSSQSPSPSPTSHIKSPSPVPAGSPNSLAATDAASSPPPPTTSPSTATHMASKPVDLSADDLLPILIYVLVHSKLTRLETQCQYMWQMSDPADLVGEAGYYLTMFSSAVEYLKQHEEEIVPPPTSQPLNIAAPTLHNVLIFDDSDSEGELSPPPTSTSWIGSKSVYGGVFNQEASAAAAAQAAGSPSSSTSPSASAVAGGHSPAFASSSSRPNRQSIFVIGNSRASIYEGQRSTNTSARSTGSTDLDSSCSPISPTPDAFSGSPSASAPSVSSTPTMETPPATLQHPVSASPTQQN